MAGGLRLALEGATDPVSRASVSLWAGRPKAGDEFFDVSWS